MALKAKDILQEQEMLLDDSGMMDELKTCYNKECRANVDFDNWTYKYKTLKSVKSLGHYIAMQVYLSEND